MRSEWIKRPGSQSAFQIMPKVCNRVKVRPLCRPLEFLHTIIVKLFCYALCKGAQSCWNRKGPSPNLSQGWKCTIVKTEFSCCSISSTLYWKQLNSIFWGGVHILLIITCRSLVDLFFFAVFINSLKVHKP